MLIFDIKEDENRGELMGKCFFSLFYGVWWLKIVYNVKNWFCLEEIDNKERKYYFYGELICCVGS